ncbi:hypothetical protein LJB90_03445 [Eubacteriales bacterium OttesenSCG-928-G02]|nr:hypothetical protein [Eubacteriales bacterium OttesenSCG-928-G02]
MKKGTYYICIKKDGSIQALERTGYIDGDIGICKIGHQWVATHIPTGCMFYGERTREAAHTAAKAVMEKATFPANVEKQMNSDAYKEWIKCVEKLKSEKP